PEGEPDEFQSLPPPQGRKSVDPVVLEGHFDGNRPWGRALTGLGRSTRGKSAPLALPEGHSSSARLLGVRRLAQPAARRSPPSGPPAHVSFRIQASSTTR